MKTLSPEIKRELLTAFNANADLKQALKEELLAGIYSNGVIVPGQVHNPLQNWALSTVFGAEDSVTNEMIGAKIVAIAEGIKFLESSFKKIEDNYKPVVVTEPGSNPAR